jgi:hypothetical protein
MNMLFNEGGTPRFYDVSGMLKRLLYFNLSPFGLGRIREVFMKQ